MGNENYDDITPAAAQRCVEQANLGDRDGALRVLELFVYFKRRGEAVPESILAYLAEAFDKVLQAADANKAIADALNLARPTHRPGQSADPRGEALALEVAELLRLGKNLDAAVEELTDRYPRCSEGVIRHAWRRNKNSSLVKERDIFPDP